MKRVIICLSIIAVIIAVGIFALNMVKAKNDRLYGHIEEVISSYEEGGDVISEINRLREYFEKDYAPKLACIINDDHLAEIRSLINRLEPMFDSDCDEFTAECESIRDMAHKIYLEELPAFFRIL